MKKILLVFFLLSFLACKDRYEREDELIQDYIKKNNYTAYRSKSGLYYIEIKKGDGIFPYPGDIAKISYICKLFSTGQVVDSVPDSLALYFKVGQGQVIAGIDEGVQYMRSGGQAIIILPSHLAYDKYGYKDIIPPYSILIFEIKLLSVIGMQ